MVFSDWISKAVLISFVFLFSCTDNYQKETKLFSTYLQKQFQTEIPEKKHFYFLVPAASCVGCRYKIYEVKKEIINMENASLIVSAYALQKDIITEEITEFNGVQLDKTDEVSRLNLGVANAMVITTNNGRISKVTEVRSGTNVRKLIEEFKTIEK